MTPPTSLPDQPIDALPIVQRRSRLARARRRIAEGRLTLGFLGGSITEDGESKWPDITARWFAKAFPQTLIVSENAGSGATGSDSACMRAQREIIDRDCDLTFVEYAVNDAETGTERRNRTREGVIRKLLAAGQEVVLVYTYSQGMYDDMIAGRVPATIAEFETLARHYGLNSVWMGLHALNEVRAGRMTWGEWLPDGLHPSPRGSWSYAEALVGFLKEELAVPAPALSSMPEEKRIVPPPLDPLHWGEMTLLPLKAIETAGPWVLRRVHNRFHVGQLLESHTPGARLRFRFTGRGLALVFEYGRRSAEFAYRIDGGERIVVERVRYEWGGECGMVQPHVIADELAPGPHVFELELIHGNRPDCTGTQMRLGLVGVLP